jgi:hypothetical protein
MGHVMDLFGFRSKDHAKDGADTASPVEALKVVIERKKEHADWKDKVHQRMVDRGADFYVGSAEAPIVAPDNPEPA